MTALTVTLRNDLQGYLLTGPGSGEALGAASLPQPEQRLSAMEQAGALVARTGTDEFMVFLPEGHPLPVHNWCFRRADRVLAVRGDNWHELMARVCQFDFRTFEPGGWLMASVAGVNCWLYRTKNDDTLLVGVGDGFHRYLETLFNELACELQDSNTHEGGAS
ncbi:hypothetical protein [uncultured Marinobacter sp.]|jgi:GGDEF domain-containing protein|uniref:hypothetical protein n=1 Tax=uncultured Marinobacter sp. TaxID=187379 RepID=UPI000D48A85A|nr:hypothetical protein [uncultured Marinobacter sp.]PTB93605.1 hypothetical protein C9974_08020 [Marinobacter sp. B9-2]